MIYIKKGAEPEWLIDVKAHNKGLTYDDERFTPYKEQLRKELINEQKGICAYCCARIDVENAHNEHIEPRHWKDGRNSIRSLDYTNLVASCNGFHGEKTCGLHKGNEYDSEKFVSPLYPECEEKFSYYPNGSIVGDDYTIGILNLNSYQLRKAREAVYKSIMYMEKEDIIQVYMNEQNELMPFVNVIKWYVNSSMV
ncbi:MAG: retron system putative HNH endonuclease [Lachnospiraceae bacterium]